MKKQYHFEFEDESSSGVLEFESDLSARLNMEVVEGVPFLYANREGMLTLAKILIQMSLATYWHGYHVHLSKNFEPNGPECLCVMLDLPTESQEAISPQQS